MVNLTDENFESEILNFSGFAIVDFFSMWCSPCNMLMPVFERLSMSPQNTDIRFGKLNTAENLGAARRFGVDAIPTILFFKDGKLVKKLLGYQNENALQKCINELK